MKDNEIIEYLIRGGEQIEAGERVPDVSCLKSFGGINMGRYGLSDGVMEGDKGTRAGVMGALANIIDPSAKTWDDSKVNLDFI